MIQINDLIKEAMHNKDMRLLGVLKLIKSEFVKKQTEAGRSNKELTEEEQIKILLKMISQREDSIKQYNNCGRQDLAEAEKLIIQQTLASMRGNKSKAAQVLGIGRKTLHRKLEEYGIISPSEKE